MFKRPVYKKTEQGFDIIENVFSLKERWIMKRQLCPLVKDLGKDYPGLQSTANLHEDIETKKLFNFYEKLFKVCNINNPKISKSWINRADKFTISRFHNHICDNITTTIVYYLTNPEKIGTIVDIDGEKIHYKSKENSILILPSHIKHKAPRVNKTRYSVVVDLL